MRVGLTLWFTGLSGSGKTTLSTWVAARLREEGHTVVVLDGHELRETLCRDLGFSKVDRDEHIRRVGELCHLLTQSGIIALAAAIAPYREARQRNRALIGRYVEIYCACPLEVLIERDTRGHYARALTGGFQSFTGVDDPYEAPEAPELTVHTDRESSQQSGERVMAFLRPFLGG